MDPETKLLLVIEVGTRTLAMAQRVLHQVAQCLAPPCLPLFLTDGYKEYATALLTHFGQWVQPPRPPGHRANPQAALDAAARAAVCAGDQNNPQAPSGACHAPGGVWHSWKPSSKR